MSQALKLLALDEEDLLVLSAHVQDSVTKPVDIDYSGTDKSLVIPLNRFAWEAPSARRILFKKYERRRSVLHFANVQSIRSLNIDRADDSQVLSLLAIEFEKSDKPDDPGGQIHLTFASQASIVMTVECIDARLTDLGGAWSAGSKPKHGV